jgi:hypothetical protein
MLRIMFEMVAAIVGDAIEYIPMVWGPVVGPKGFSNAR